MSRYGEPKVEQRIEYVLDGWTPPAECRGCRFTVDRVTLDVRCPAHGASSENPIVGPVELPPTRTVPYINGRRVSAGG